MNLITTKYLILNSRKIPIFKKIKATKLPEITAHLAVSYLDMEYLNCLFF